MNDLQFARLRRSIERMEQASQELAALQAELESELQGLAPGCDEALPNEEACDALAAAQELLADAVDSCEEAGLQ